MRYLSVCSGIEAASVAWHPLGWSPAGFSDIDPFPRAVLKHRFGAQAVDFDKHVYDPKSNVIPLFGDFTKIQEHHVGPIDLLVGGTPCQSFSVAGKRLGLDDPRGNLAIEFLALAKRVRARWVAWENVPGVLSSWSGDAPGAPVDEDGRWVGDARRGWEAEYPETGDFHAFLELFRECGYRGCYRVLDAQFVRVDGLDRAVPQRRRRVFVVGHLGDDSRAIPVLFEPESLRGHTQPRRQPGQGFARDTVPSLTGSSVGARRAGESRGQDPVIAERLAFGGNNTTGPIDVATAVRAHGTQHGDFESETFISEAITFPEYLSGTAEVGEQDVSNSLQARNPTAVAFSCKDSGQDAADDVSPTLRSMGHDDADLPSRKRHRNHPVRQKVKDQKVVGDHTGGIGGNRVDTAGVARILVECRCRECRAGDALPARLQGIPGARQLTFINGAKEPAMTDKLREACRDRCAQAGDPPCYRFDDEANMPFTACSECLNEVGETPAVALDPDAVIRNLI